MTVMHVSHGFGPIIDSHSRILILGSFPSVRSRSEQFFYLHPANRFWRVISCLTGEDFLSTNIEGKIALLHKHGIALYDVVESCDVEGSLDVSIRNVVPAEIRKLLKIAPIQIIALNGGKASALFRRFFPDLKEKIICLPSTSPANAVWSLDCLIQAWNILFP